MAEQAEFCAGCIGKMLGVALEHDRTFPDNLLVQFLLRGFDFVSAAVIGFAILQIQIVALRRGFPRLLIPNDLVEHSAIGGQQCVCQHQYGRHQDRQNGQDRGVQNVSCHLPWRKFFLLHVFPPCFCFHRFRQGSVWNCYYSSRFQAFCFRNCISCCFFVHNLQFTGKAG